MIEIRQLGLTRYKDIWNLQKELQSALIAETGPEVILVCQHYPVITLGKSSKPENVLADKSSLEAQKVEIFQIERGGDVTFHGPGQLVAYPILDLRLRKRDVGWYMRQLEEVVIRTLAAYQVEGLRIPGKTGVWVNNSATKTVRKISSLGVRLSRWCSMHGLSLNVASQPGQLSLEQGFALIHPCGFRDIEITSLQMELPKIPIAVADIEPRLVENLRRIFDLSA